MSEHRRRTSRAEGAAVWSVLSLAALSAGLLVAATARLYAVTSGLAAQLPAPARRRSGSSGVTPILGPTTGRPAATAPGVAERVSPTTGTVRIFPPA